MEGGKRKRAEMEGGDAGGNRALFAAVEAHTGAAVDGLRLVEEEASTGDRLTAARDLPARRRTSGRQVVTRHAVHDRELTDVHDAQAGHCLIALPHCPQAPTTKRHSMWRRSLSTAGRGAHGSSSSNGRGSVRRRLLLGATLKPPTQHSADCVPSRAQSEVIE